MVNLALYKRKILVVFLDVLVYNYFLSNLTDNSMYISYYIRLMYEETLSFIFMLKKQDTAFHYVGSVVSNIPRMRNDVLWSNGNSSE